MGWHIHCQGSLVQDPLEEGSLRWGLSSPCTCSPTWGNGEPSNPGESAEWGELFHLFPPKVLVKHTMMKSPLQIISLKVMIFFFFFNDLTLSRRRGSGPLTILWDGLEKKKLSISVFQRSSKCKSSPTIMPHPHTLQELPGHEGCLFHQKRWRAAKLFQQHKQQPISPGNYSPLLNFNTPSHL